MEEHQVLIGEEQLFHFVGELFQYAGMPRGGCPMHARALVDTDLWGISSHGVMRVPAYFTRMLKRQRSVSGRRYIRRPGTERWRCWTATREPGLW